MSYDCVLVFIAVVFYLSFSNSFFLLYFYYGVLLLHCIGAIQCIQCIACVPLGFMMLTNVMHSAYIQMHHYITWELLSVR